MPYDNKLNREIADRLRRNLERLIQHCPMSYEVAEGSMGNANKDLIDKENIQEYRDKYEEMEESLPQPTDEKDKKDEKDYTEEENDNKDEEEKTGGALVSKGGFAKGTLRDLGFEKIEGAGKPTRRPRKIKTSLSVNKDVMDKEKGLLLKRTLEGGKPLRPFIKSIKRRAKIANPLDIMGVIGNIASKTNIPILSDVGDMIKTGTDVLNMGMNRQNNLNTVADNVMGSIGLGKKRGRPNKMKKGGSSNLGETFNMIKPDGTTGNIKGKGRQIGGNKVLYGNQMSSSMAGQGKPKRKPNDTIKRRSELVKKIMKEQNLSMIDASKYVKQNNLKY